jgi:5-formyltetrahydrofolate cyclo-ligase
LDQQVRDEKRRLRAALSQSLRRVSSEQAEDAGQRAARELLAWSGFAPASEIVAFASQAGELDTRPFLEATRCAGKTALLPRIRGEDLEFAPVDDFEGLVSGRYGVLEPGPDCVARSVAAHAIVLVPGLAFDAQGGRLGRGAGYYDRALAGLRRRSDSATFIGVGFAMQVIDRVPMTSHDVRIDAILTEDALLWAVQREVRSE